MTELSKNSTVEHTQALLTRYGFDLDGCEAVQLATQWAHDYQVRWICSAVVEALYQGRYKAVSVEQILLFWERRGEPICHFNRDFERIIRGHSASGLATKPDAQPSLTPSESSEAEPEAIVATAPESSKTEGGTVESSAGWFTHPPFATSSEPALLQALETDSPELTDTEPAEAEPAITSDLVALFSPAPSLPNLPMEDCGSVHPATDPASISMEDLHYSPETRTHDAESVPSQAALPSNDNEPNLTVSDVLLESARIPDPAIVSPPESKFPTRAFRLLPKPIRAEVYQADWSRCQVSKRPIGRFVPASEASEFYTKLKAVAKGE